MSSYKLLLVAALTASLSLGWAGSSISEASEDMPMPTRQKARTMVPPPPLAKPVELYDRGTPFAFKFPKYFTFLADGRGLAGEGAVRIKTKKLNDKTKQLEVATFEVRSVGEIMASMEGGGTLSDDSAEKALTPGPLMLSTSDDVIVRFSADLAKLLDSDTYGDSDPYFREFPIYGVSTSILETGWGRADRGRNKGELYKYKGKLTVVARIEGIAPISSVASGRLKANRNNDMNNDVEPVTYVARISYAEDAIAVNDKLFYFIPLNNGPERVLEPLFVGKPDSYVALGD